MKRKVLVLLLGALALITAPIALAREEPGTGAGWVVGTPSFSYENVLADLISDEHARVCGVGLTQQVQLDSYARYKAADMGWENYFAHANEVGHNFWDLYPRGSIEWTAAGEILAWNTVEDALAPGNAYTQFMGSTAHKAAIQNCVYTQFGVGSFKAETSTAFKKYWAVEFIKP